MTSKNRSKDNLYRTRLSWENGYCQSFNSKLRDEFLNGEILHSIKKLHVLAGRWRIHYDINGLHSLLGYRRRQPRLG